MMRWGRHFLNSLAPKLNAQCDLQHNTAHQNLKGYTRLTIIGQVFCIFSITLHVKNL